MKKTILAIAALCASALLADVYIIDGERVEGEVHEFNGMRTICTDTMCMELPDDAIKVEDETPAQPVPETSAQPVPETPAQVRLGGYMDAPTFVSFLKGNAETGAGAATETEGEEGGSMLAGKSWWLVLILALVGGLCMNLTPCVLPMVPINLMIIGKSAARGAFYGLGIALAYGVLGLLASVGGMAFGTIQGNPWFNVGIAILFAVLGLSMMGVFMIDLSKNRGSFTAQRSKMNPAVFAFVMGIVSAILAGACVAPVLLAIITYTIDMNAAGCRWALGLPFVFGLGMALPWPLVGAGMQVLPKPGGWMKWVNKIFGLLLFVFAAWYAFLAYTGFKARQTEATATVTTDAEGRQTLVVTSPKAFSLEGLQRPVLVDCWASWCKNCAAMERTTLAAPEVKEAMKNFTVVKLQCEKIGELKAHPDFTAVAKEIKGLPAFVIFE